MASGQQITLEPALAQVLAEHLHDAALGRQVVVVLVGRQLPAAIGLLEHRLEPVRRCLIRAEQAERSAVVLVGVVAVDVAHQLAEHLGGLVGECAGGLDVQGVGLQRRDLEGDQGAAAVGVRRRTHPQLTPGCQVGEVVDECTRLVEQVVRLVRPQPFLEQGEVFGIFLHPRQRDLMTPVGALDQFAVHLVRSRPALGGAHHDGRPFVAGRVAFASAGLDLDDLVVSARDCLRHRREHLMRVVAADEHGLPALARQERRDVVVAAAAEDGGAGDLGPVEVQDRQHRTIASRVEECRDLPGTGEGAGLGLAVADHTRDHQIGAVEGGTRGVDERIAEFTALVDRTRCLHAHMAGDSTRCGELPAQCSDPIRIRGHVRIDLAVGALEVGRCHQRRAAVPRPGDVEPFRVGLADAPVEQCVDHREPRTGAPVSEQSGLDVLDAERLAEQDVVLQIDLRHRQVVGRGPPPQIEFEFGIGVSGQRHVRTFWVFCGQGMSIIGWVRVTRHGSGTQSSRVRSAVTNVLLSVGIDSLTLPPREHARPQVRQVLSAKCTCSSRRCWRLCRRSSSRPGHLCVNVPLRRRAGSPNAGGSEY